MFAVATPLDRINYLVSPNCDDYMIMLIIPTNLSLGPPTNLLLVLIHMFMKKKTCFPDGLYAGKSVFVEHVHVCIVTSELA